jgi:hypothetical protein
MGIGFVLGSKAGRQPYETLESKVKEVSAREDVTAAAERAATAARNVKERAFDAGTDSLERASQKVDAVVQGG